jgi:DNA-binding NarL/FixJ family response regulator
MVPARAPKTYSILLAHPLTLVREGLASLCRRPQYRVVDQCSDGELRLSHAQTRIVVLSNLKDRKTVVEVLRAGVNAFLHKSDSADQFVECLDRILDGSTYISPSLDLHRIFSPRQAAASADPFATLSPREYQVFCLLVEGTRPKEIGARLGLNPKTIDTYRVNLMRKLDIHDVAGLVKFAIQRGLTSSR